MIDYFNYFIDIQPLLYFHAAIRPLSTIDFYRLPTFFQDIISLVDRHFPLYDLLIDINGHKLDSDSLTLVRSEDGRTLSPWYTWITYMFVHSNYDHMYKNMTALLLDCYPLYRSSGAQYHQVEWVNHRYYLQAYQKSPVSDPHEDQR